MKTTSKTIRFLTLVMMLSLTLCVIAFASYADGASYPAIGLNEEKLVTLDGAQKTEEIFSFVPEQSGYYAFEAVDSEYDNYGYILDSDGTELARNDDYGGSHHFCVVHYMNAGDTYLLKARFYTTTESGTITVRVTTPKMPDSIVVEDTYSDYLGANKNFDHSVLPEDSFKQDVIWSAEDPSIVDINEEGYAYFIGVGTTTVTATTNNGLSDSCTVTVLEPITAELDTEYTVSPDEYPTGSYYFTPEETAYYAFYSYGAVSETYGFIYDSHGNLIDFDDVGAPDEFYIQCELQAGERYNLVGYYNASESAPFCVKIVKLEPATALSLDDSTLIGHVGRMARLEVLFSPTNAIRENTSWSSSNESVATVDSEGYVTFLSVGAATITAKSESGLSASCAVTVTDIPEISTCERILVDIEAAGDVAYLYFTPSIDGRYAFYSLNEDNLDTYGYIYEGDTELASNDDGGADMNFRIEYDLAKDTKYTLKAQMRLNDKIGSFSVVIVRLDENNRELHNYVYTYTDSTHSSTCADCGTTLANEPHSYDLNNTCACGYVHLHTYTPEFDAVNHYGDCVTCGMGVSENHKFDSNGLCSCGYELHEHNLKNLRYNDGYYHVGECTVCTFNVYVEHEFDAEGSCVCGYYLHEHDYSEYGYDNYEHWNACTICHLESPDVTRFAHEYDENGECVCGRERLVGASLGDINITDGEYIDLDGNVSTVKPIGGYAHYDDGVLTLNNFVLVAEDVKALFAETDIKIILKGQNKIYCEDNDAIYFTNASLTIEGDGSLDVFSGDNTDGIDVNGGDFILNSGTLVVHGTDHGLEVDGKLEINGGKLYVEAEDDGFDVEGDVEINGGYIYIYADDYGIDSEYDVEINGGYIYVYADDYNGIYALENITVNGGTLEIVTEDDDGICAEGSVEINGGKLIITLEDESYTAIFAYDDIILSDAMPEYDVIEYADGYALGLDGEALRSTDIKDDYERISIKQSWIELLREAFVPNKNGINIELEVIDDDGNELVYGTDYTVVLPAEAICNEGSYVITVKGIGAYCGEVLVLIRVEISTVRVGGVKLNDGEYLASGSFLPTKEAPTSGGYAYYSGGTLTLNNYVYEGAGFLYDSTVGYFALIHSDGALDIVLVGENRLIGASDGREIDGIAASYYLTVDGDGSLEIVAMYGIYVYSGTASFNGGSFDITAKETGLYGNRVDVNDGKLVIDANFGIVGSEININAGELDITAQTHALSATEGVNIADTVTVSVPENGSVTLAEDVYSYVDAEGEVALTLKAKGLPPVAPPPPGGSGSEGGNGGSTDNLNGGGEEKTPDLTFLWVLIPCITAALGAGGFAIYWFVIRKKS